MRATVALTGLLATAVAALVLLWPHVAGSRAAVATPAHLLAAAASNPVGVRPRERVALAPGQQMAFVSQTCGACHSLRNITYAHFAAPDWAKEVAKMNAFGAGVPKDRIAAVVAYLSARYGKRSR